jgi:hypothetical protein
LVVYQKNLINYNIATIDKPPSDEVIDIDQPPIVAAFAVKLHPDLSISTRASKQTPTICKQVVSL